MVGVSNVLAFRCEVARVLFQCTQDGVRTRLLQRLLIRHSGDGAVAIARE